MSDSINGLNPKLIPCSVVLRNLNPAHLFNSTTVYSPPEKHQKTTNKRLDTECPNDVISSQVSTKSSFNFTESSKEGDKELTDADKSEELVTVNDHEGNNLPQCVDTNNTEAAKFKAQFTDDAVKEATNVEISEESQCTTNGHKEAAKVKMRKESECTHAEQEATGVRNEFQCIDEEVLSNKDSILPQSYDEKSDEAESIHMNLSQEVEQSYPPNGVRKYQKKGIRGRRRMDTDSQSPSRSSASRNGRKRSAEVAPPVTKKRAVLVYDSRDVAGVANETQEEGDIHEMRKSMNANLQKVSMVPYSRKQKETPPRKKTLIDSESGLSSDDSEEEGKYKKMKKKKSNRYYKDATYVPHFYWRSEVHKTYRERTAKKALSPDEFTFDKEGDSGINTDSNLTNDIIINNLRKTSCELIGNTCNVKNQNVSEGSKSKKNSNHGDSVNELTDDTEIPLCTNSCSKYKQTKKDAQSQNKDSADNKISHFLYSESGEIQNIDDLPSKRDVASVKSTHNTAISAVYNCSEKTCDGKESSSNVISITHSFVNSKNTFEKEQPITLRDIHDNQIENMSHNGTLLNTQNKDITICAKENTSASDTLSKNLTSIVPIEKAETAPTNEDKDNHFEMMPQEKFPANFTKDLVHIQNNGITIYVKENISCNDVCSKNQGCEVTILKEKTRIQPEDNSNQLEIIPQHKVVSPNYMDDILHIQNHVTSGVKGNVYSSDTLPSNHATNVLNEPSEPPTPFESPDNHFESTPLSTNDDDRTPVYEDYFIFHATPCSKTESSYCNVSSKHKHIKISIENTEPNKAFHMLQDEIILIQKENSTSFVKDNDLKTNVCNQSTENAITCYSLDAREGCNLPKFEKYTKVRGFLLKNRAKKCYICNVFFFPPKANSRSCDVCVRISRIHDPETVMIYDDTEKKSPKRYPVKVKKPLRETILKQLPKQDVELLQFQAKVDHSIIQKQYDHCESLTTPDDNVIKVLVDMEELHPVNNSEKNSQTNRERRRICLTLKKNFPAEMIDNDIVLISKRDVESSLNHANNGKAKGNKHAHSVPQLVVLKKSDILWRDYLESNLYKGDDFNGRNIETNADYDKEGTEDFCDHNEFSDSTVNNDLEVQVGKPDFEPPNLEIANNSSADQLHIHHNEPPNLEKIDTPLESRDAYCNSDVTTDSSSGHDTGKSDTMNDFNQSISKGKHSNLTLENNASTLKILDKSCDSDIPSGNFVKIKDASKADDVSDEPITTSGNISDKKKRKRWNIRMFQKVPKKTKKGGKNKCIPAQPKPRRKYKFRKSKSCEQKFISEAREIKATRTPRGFLSKNVDCQRKITIKENKIRNNNKARDSLSKKCIPKISSKNTKLDSLEKEQNVISNCMSRKKKLLIPEDSRKTEMYLGIKRSTAKRVIHESNRCEKIMTNNRDVNKGSDVERKFANFYPKLSRKIKENGTDQDKKSSIACGSVIPETRTQFNSISTNIHLNKYCAISRNIAKSDQCISQNCKAKDLGLNIKLSTAKEANNSEPCMSENDKKKDIGLNQKPSTPKDLDPRKLHYFQETEIDLNLEHIIGKEMNFDAKTLQISKERAIAVYERYSFARKSGNCDPRNGHRSQENNIDTLKEKDATSNCVADPRKSQRKPEGGLKEADDHCAEIKRGNCDPRNRQSNQENNIDTLKEKDGTSHCVADPRKSQRKPEGGLKEADDHCAEIKRGNCDPRNRQSNQENNIDTLKEKNSTSNCVADPRKSQRKPEGGLKEADDHCGEIKSGNCDPRNRQSNQENNIDTLKEKDGTSNCADDPRKSQRKPEGGLKEADDHSAEIKNGNCDPRIQKRQENNIDTLKEKDGTSNCADDPRKSQRKPEGGLKEADDHSAEIKNGNCDPRIQKRQENNIDTLKEKDGTSNCADDPRKSQRKPEGGLKEADDHSAEIKSGNCDPRIQKRQKNNIDTLKEKDGTSNCADDPRKSQRKPEDGLKEADDHSAEIKSGNCDPRIQKRQENNIDTLKKKDATKKWVADSRFSLKSIQNYVRKSVNSSTIVLQRRSENDRYKIKESYLAMNRMNYDSRILQKRNEMYVESELDVAPKRVKTNPKIPLVVQTLKTTHIFGKHHISHKSINCEQKRTPLKLKLKKNDKFKECKGCNARDTIYFALKKIEENRIHYPENKKLLEDKNKRTLFKTNGIPVKGQLKIREAGKARKSYVIIKSNNNYAPYAIPDYIITGNSYLGKTCEEIYRIALNKTDVIGIPNRNKNSSANCNFTCAMLTHVANGVNGVNKSKNKHHSRRSSTETTQLQVRTVKEHDASELNIRQEQKEKPSGFKEDVSTNRDRIFKGKVDTCAELASNIESTKIHTSLKDDMLNKESENNTGSMIRNRNLENHHLTKINQPHNGSCIVRKGKESNLAKSSKTQFTIGNTTRKSDMNNSIIEFTGSIDNNYPNRETKVANGVKTPNLDTSPDTQLEIGNSDGKSDMTNEFLEIHISADKNHPTEDMEKPTKVKTSNLDRSSSTQSIIGNSDEKSNKSNELIDIIGLTDKNEPNESNVENEVKTPYLDRSSQTQSTIGYLDEQYNNTNENLDSTEKVKSSNNKVITSILDKSSKTQSALGNSNINNNIPDSIDVPYLNSESKVKKEVKKSDLDKSSESGFVVENSTDYSNIKKKISGSADRNHSICELNVQNVVEIPNSHKSSKTQSALEISNIENIIPYSTDITYLNNKSTKVKMEVKKSDLDKSSEYEFIVENSTDDSNKKNKISGSTDRNQPICELNVENGVKILNSDKSSKTQAALGNSNIDNNISELTDITYFNNKSTKVKKEVKKSDLDKSSESEFVVENSNDDSNRKNNISRSADRNHPICELNVQNGVEIPNSDKSSKTQSALENSNIENIIPYSTDITYLNNKSKIENEVNKSDLDKSSEYEFIVENSTDDSNKKNKISGSTDRNHPICELNVENGVKTPNSNKSSTTQFAFKNLSRKSNINKEYIESPSSTDVNNKNNESNEEKNVSLSKLNKNSKTQFESVKNACVNFNMDNEIHSNHLIKTQEKVENEIKTSDLDKSTKTQLSQENSIRNSNTNNEYPEIRGSTDSIHPNEKHDVEKEVKISNLEGQSQVQFPNENLSGISPISNYSLEISSSTDSNHAKDDSKKNKDKASNMESSSQSPPDSSNGISSTTNDLHEDPSSTEINHLNGKEIKTSNLQEISQAPKVIRKKRSNIKKVENYKLKLRSKPEDKTISNFPNEKIELPQNTLGSQNLFHEVLCDKIQTKEVFHTIEKPTAISTNNIKRTSKSKNSSHFAKKDDKTAEYSNSDRKSKKNSAHKTFSKVCPLINNNMQNSSQTKNTSYEKKKTGERKKKLKFEKNENIPNKYNLRASNKMNEVQFLDIIIHDDKKGANRFKHYIDIPILKEEAIFDDTPEINVYKAVPADDQMTDFHSFHCNNIDKEISKSGFDSPKGKSSETLKTINSDENGTYYMQKARSLDKAEVEKVKESKNNEHVYLNELHLGLPTKADNFLAKSDSSHLYDGGYTIEYPKQIKKVKRNVEKPINPFDSETSTGDSQTNTNSETSVIKFNKCLDDKEVVEEATSHATTSEVIVNSKSKKLSDPAKSNNGIKLMPNCAMNRDLVKLKCNESEKDSPHRAQIKNSEKLKIEEEEKNPQSDNTPPFLNSTSSEILPKITDINKITCPKNNSLETAVVSEDNVDKDVKELMSTLINLSADIPNNTTMNCYGIDKLCNSEKVESTLNNDVRLKAISHGDIEEMDTIQKINYELIDSETNLKIIDQIHDTDSNLTVTKKRKGRPAKLNPISGDIVATKTYENFKKRDKLKTSDGVINPTNESKSIGKMANDSENNRCQTNNSAKTSNDTSHISKYKATKKRIGRPPKLKSVSENICKTNKSADIEKSDIFEKVDVEQNNESAGIKRKRRQTKLMPISKYIKDYLNDDTPSESKQCTAVEKAELLKTTKDDLSTYIQNGDAFCMANESGDVEGIGSLENKIGDGVTESTITVQNILNKNKYEPVIAEKPNVNNPTADCTKILTISEPTKDLNTNTEHECNELRESNDLNEATCNDRLETFLAELSQREVTVTVQHSTKPDITPIIDLMSQDEVENNVDPASSTKSGAAEKDKKKCRTLNSELLDTFSAELGQKAETVNAHLTKPNIIPTTDLMFNAEVENNIDPISSQKPGARKTGQEECRTENSKSVSCSDQSNSLSANELNLTLEIVDENLSQPQTQTFNSRAAQEFTESTVVLGPQSFDLTAKASDPSSEPTENQKCSEISQTQSKVLKRRNSLKKTKPGNKKNFNYVDDIFKKYDRRLKLLEESEKLQLTRKKYIRNSKVIAQLRLKEAGDEPTITNITISQEEDCDETAVKSLTSDKTATINHCDEEIHKETYHGDKSLVLLDFPSPTNNFSDSNSKSTEPQTIQGNDQEPILNPICVNNEFALQNSIISTYQVYQIPIFVPTVVVANYIVSDVRNYGNLDSVYYRYKPIEPKQTETVNLSEPGNSNLFSSTSSSATVSFETNSKTNSTSSNTDITNEPDLTMSTNSTVKTGVLPLSSKSDNTSAIPVSNISNLDNPQNVTQNTINVVQDLKNRLLPTPTHLGTCSITESERSTAPQTNSAAELDSNSINRNEFGEFIGNKKFLQKQYRIKYFQSRGLNSFTPDIYTNLKKKYSPWKSNSVHEKIFNTKYIHSLEKAYLPTDRGIRNVDNHINCTSSEPTKQGCASNASNRNSHTDLCKTADSATHEIENVYNFSEVNNDLVSFKSKESCVPRKRIQSPNQLKHKSYVNDHKQLVERQSPEKELTHKQKITNSDNEENENISFNVDKNVSLNSNCSKDANLGSNVSSSNTTENHTPENLKTDSNHGLPTKHFAKKKTFLRKNSKDKLPGASTPKRTGKMKKYWQNTFATEVTNDISIDEITTTLETNTQTYTKSKDPPNVPLISEQHFVDMLHDLQVLRPRQSHCPDMNNLNKGVLIPERKKTCNMMNCNISLPETQNSNINVLNFQQQRDYENKAFNCNDADNLYATTDMELDAFAIAAITDLEKNPNDVLENLVEVSKSSSRIDPTPFQRALELTKRNDIFSQLSENIIEQDNLTKQSYQEKSKDQEFLINNDEYYVTSFEDDFFPYHIPNSVVQVSPTSPLFNIESNSEKASNDGTLLTATKVIREKTATSEKNISSDENKTVGPKPRKKRGPYKTKKKLSSNILKPKRKYVRKALKTSVPRPKRVNKSSYSTTDSSSNNTGEIENLSDLSHGNSEVPNSVCESPQSISLQNPQNVESDLISTRKDYLTQPPQPDLSSAQPKMGIHSLKNHPETALTDTRTEKEHGPVNSSHSNPVTNLTPSPSNIALEQSPILQTQNSMNEMMPANEQNSLDSTQSTLRIRCSSNASIQHASIQQSQISENNSTSKETTSAKLGKSKKSIKILELRESSLSHQLQAAAKNIILTKDHCPNMSTHSDSTHILNERISFTEDLNKSSLTNQPQDTRNDKISEGNIIMMKICSSNSLFSIFNQLHLENDYEQQSSIQHPNTSLNNLISTYKPTAAQKNSTPMSINSKSTMDLKQPSLTQQPQTLKNNSATEEKCRHLQSASFNYISILKQSLHNEAQTSQTQQPQTSAGSTMSTKENCSIIPVISNSTLARSPSTNNLKPLTVSKQTPTPASEAVLTKEQSSPMPAHTSSISELSIYNENQTTAPKHHKIAENYIISTRDNDLNMPAQSIATPVPSTSNENQYTPTQQTQNSSSDILSTRDHPLPSTPILVPSDENEKKPILSQLLQTTGKCARDCGLAMPVKSNSSTSLVPIADYTENTTTQHQNSLVGDTSTRDRCMLIPAHSNSTQILPHRTVDGTQSSFVQQPIPLTSTREPIDPVFPNHSPILFHPRAKNDAAKSDVQQSPANYSMSLTEPISPLPAHTNSAAILDSRRTTENTQTSSIQKSLASLNTTMTAREHNEPPNLNRPRQKKDLTQSFRQPNQTASNNLPLTGDISSKTTVQSNSSQELIYGDYIDDATQTSPFQNPTELNKDTPLQAQPQTSVINFNSTRDNIIHLTSPHDTGNSTIHPPVQHSETSEKTHMRDNFVSNAVQDNITPENNTTCFSDDSRQSTPHPQTSTKNRMSTREEASPNLNQTNSTTIRYPNQTVANNLMSRGQFVVNPAHSTPNPLSIYPHFRNDSTRLQATQRLQHRTNIMSFDSQCIPNRAHANSTPFSNQSAQISTQNNPMSTRVQSFPNPAHSTPMNHSNEVMTPSSSIQKLQTSTGNLVPSNDNHLQVPAQENSVPSLIRPLPTYQPTSIQLAPDEPPQTPMPPLPAREHYLSNPAYPNPAFIAQANQPNTYYGSPHPMPYHSQMTDPRTPYAMHTVQAHPDSYYASAHHQYPAQYRPVQQLVNNPSAYGSPAHAISPPYYYNASHEIPNNGSVTNSYPPYTGEHPYHRASISPEQNQNVMPIRSLHQMAGTNSIPNYNSNENENERVRASQIEQEKVAWLHRAIQEGAPKHIIDSYIEYHTGRKPASTRGRRKSTK